MDAPKFHVATLNDIECVYYILYRVRLIAVPSSRGFRLKTFLQALSDPKNFAQDAAGWYWKISSRQPKGLPQAT